MTWQLFLFIGLGLVVFLYAIMAARIFPKKVQSTRPRPQRGEDTGGIMNQIARWVTLGLGHLTFGALHLFEKLGVDMARVDEVIASWTAWSENIKTALADALADAQNLRDTDAAEDAAQANALSETVADKVQAAFDAVSAPPTTPPAEGDTTVPDSGVATP